MLLLSSRLAVKSLGVLAPGVSCPWEDWLDRSAVVGSDPMSGESTGTLSLELLGSAQASPGNTWDVLHRQPPKCSHPRRAG